MGTSYSFKNNIVVNHELLKANNMSEKMELCPWGNSCSFEICIEDDEGNFQGNLGCEYENNPRRGGSWYSIHHIPKDCPAGEFWFGSFSSIDELMYAWNKRKRICHAWKVIKNSDDEITGFMCECGNRSTTPSRYCSNCGARMWLVNV